MTKTTMSKPLVFLFAAAALSVAACGGGNEVNIEEGVLGYWIESNSTGGLMIDGSGYGWGYEIARNGDLTVARLDWNAETLTTEATGPFAKLVTASGGVWEIEGVEEGPTQGSYSLSTVTTQEVTHPFLTINMGGETEYYVKVAELQ